MRFLSALMILTDLAFIAYWTAVVMSLIPTDYLFKDYNNPIVVDWNYSFLPLDLLISATGLLSMGFRRGGFFSWYPLCVVSLTLTFCSGLQAVAFWAMRADYDPIWWGANLFLMAYPAGFLPGMLCLRPEQANKERIRHRSSPAR
jgi:hypothetical protein